MFQNYTATTRPEDGPPRLRALRHALQGHGVDGFIIPRADAHQGEYVASCDERLAWLTGFTGSAGFCIVLPDRAGLFVDGRYRVQAKLQCAPDFTPVNWPETKPADWLCDTLPAGGVVGFDPWLHTPDEIDALEKGLKGSGISLQRMENQIDAIWNDRPAPPSAPAYAYPEDLAGASAASKRRQVGAALATNDQRATVLTQPDSICWLLNIRGADLPRLPVVQGFAIVHDDGRVDLFAPPEKLAAVNLGSDVQIHPFEAFEPALRKLAGPVQLDKGSVPLRVLDILRDCNTATSFMPDPCQQPKARKTPAELAGARAAHLRDGAAMVEFLCWLDAQAAALVARPDHVLTEIDIARHLESCRHATGALRDLSFDTIAGSGPNGAIVHYRVTEASNRRLIPGDLMLVDSGGQYLDGTTDITRTIAIGPVGGLEAACFTRVLQGMIAISRARFPRGVAGGHLDALARYPLWLAGLDYDHGTGHGVGAFLSVHEGPQRLSRISQVPLAEGMILSNEPGYYREGEFGIRIENLVTVRMDPAPEGGDPRDWLAFETLTLAPIDTRLVVPDMLSADERAWLNHYHARVVTALSPLLPENARNWLVAACKPV
ncbi:aminopeptidase P family protein [Roseinatronobacter alkalisoli]|uniref:Aminopeptidase P family protein n=1 Tax=Roseinatronobacter alkalisoli TaxID=3028235 RepID=A0ABT5T862_9RHOB|nr:aminopeptidase P family protein [Roseinatronobacter sp. HJB301]MDD7971166.1 aminopeptidase P family protein [Roseinatronobacter sp. HJB301]